MENLALQANLNRLEARKSVLPNIAKSPTICVNTYGDAALTTLESLNECLIAFVDHYTTFFQQGFMTGGAYTFQPSALYSPNYVLHILRERVGHDLDVINRAKWYRLYEPSSIQQQTLSLADKLAYNALKRSAEANLIRRTTAVTHFHKSLFSRVVPYAPVALIGIPFYTASYYHSQTIQGNDTEDQLSSRLTDLPAVAHEVGHYVYWHAPLHGGQLPQLLSQHQQTQPTWLQRWMEEIFADLFGLLIAGPIAAFTFQDLLLSNNREGLLDDDGEHPVGALRGLIQADMVRKLGFSNSADVLEKRWEQFLTDLELPCVFVPKSAQLQVAVAFADARAIISDLVQNILVLDLYRLLDQAQWTKDIPPNQNAKDIYEQFEKYLSGVKDNQLSKPPKVIIQGDTPNRDVQLVELPEEQAKEPIQLLSFNVGKTGSWLDSFIDTIQQGKLPFNVPVDAWVAALNSAGWTDGPADNTTPKKGK